VGTGTEPREWDGDGEKSCPRTALYFIELGNAVSSV